MKNEVENWLAKAQEIVTNYFEAHYSNLTAPILTITEGRRYYRVISDHSAFAFIDKTNGNILKPSSWNSPAKGARGNLSDKFGGIGRVSSTSVY